MVEKMNTSESLMRQSKKQRNNMDNEGWSIDITKKGAVHYYKNGMSLCGKKILREYMKHFDSRPNFSAVLGYPCSICSKKINKK